MALPGDYPLEGEDAVYRGDWYGFRATLDDDGVAVSLPDRTWRAQIRASSDLDAALLATGTVDATDAATGVVTVVFPASETAGISAAAGYWDLEATLIADDENVRTWLAGDVEFQGDASRGA